MSSAFDPSKFMEQSADAGSTNFEPIPAKEYTAIIDDVSEPRVVAGRDGDRVVFDVNFLLQDEEVKAKLGRELKVKAGIFVDTNSNGAMDMGKGKNVRLNQLRAAVGQNKAGWKIPQLKGAGPLKVMVTLRPDKNSDAVYNDVKSFGAMK